MCASFSKEGQPMNPIKSLALLGAILAAAAAARPAALPNPILRLTGTEHYMAGGRNWVRYEYDVSNKNAYPDALFAEAPALPPCGLNTKASRSWVDIYDRAGKRLYGFCALGKASNLGALWFAVEEGVPPPSAIYIEINDRQTSTKYRSNLAPTAK
jgi:hypothetical protein